ncbi:ABC transporter substrate-binding protein [Frankia nepalensis]|uniref:ABC transporter substrate-binding protein n=1 Tax=Frankia nepalensis TaxID=1836974 RepID=UPI001EE476ED|nr:ABC transporter substrate-binding protein [Frankia nepalensis]
MAAALLVAAGCGGDGQNSGDNRPSAEASSAADPLGPKAPAQGEPVRIGIISEGKNSFTDTTIELTVAKATAAWLNERGSGIGGRPIELVTCEPQGDPGLGTDCGNRMIEEDVAAVVIGHTAVVESVWLPLSEANIPVMSYTSSGEAVLRDSESTFGLTDPIFPVTDLPIQLAKDKGVDRVTAVVIDVPAALNVFADDTPYREAGIEFELVRVPPATADMTAQLRQVAADPGVVFVVGTDSFCIAAFNGLRAVGFDGQIAAISLCASDATRKAVPGDTLDGIVIAAQVPVGTDNPSTRLYEAVMRAYGADVDTASDDGMSMFASLAALQAAVKGVGGNITPSAIISTIKAMPEIELPGGGGITFRCNGKADPEHPALCVRGGLVATLDAKGNPAEYQVLGSSPIED